MKVRIGGIEISDVTLEDLDELVRRYGGAAIEPTPNSESPAGRSAAPTGGVNAPPADVVVLKKVVEAAASGVTTKDIGEILGRRGKATRGAAKEWAKRIGLVTDDNFEPFDDCRIGTQRGLRLKSSLLDVAKHLLNQR